jgi:hypothetical protein
MAGVDGRLEGHVLDVYLQPVVPRAIEVCFDPFNTLEVMEGGV